MRNVRRLHSANRIPQLIACAGMGIVCVSLIAMGQFIAHLRPDEMDPWLFAYCGRQLLHGSRLYVDLWDIKAPGIFWINAIGLKLSGERLIGVTLLCGAASLATTGLFYSVTSKLYGRATAVIATIMAALFLNFYVFHLGGNRPATFYVLTELGTIALYLVGLRRTSHRRVAYVLAGACAGIGFCVKQTTIAALAGIVIHTLYSAFSGRVSYREAARRLTRIALGWLAVVGAAIGTLWLAGDLYWAWDAVFRFNMCSFGAGGTASLIPSIGWVGRYLLGLELPLILAGGAIVHSLVARIGPKSARDSGQPYFHSRSPVGIDDDGLMVLYCGWLIVAVYAGVIDPQERPWHLAIALTPLMLMAAHSVFLLLSSSAGEGERPRMHVIVGILWFACMLITPVRMQIAMTLRQFHHAFDAPADVPTEMLVKAIKSHSRNNETMFCFDYRPDVYWKANRPPGVRYMSTVSAGDWDDPHNPLMNKIADALEETRPKIIICGPPRSSSARAARFDRWLQDQYVRPNSTRLPGLWVRAED